LRYLVTIKPDEFLAWLMTTRSLPTTSYPGLGDYLKAYQGLANAGHEEIISICRTSGSGDSYLTVTIAQW
jgi:fatty acid-binding protein DegV